MVLVSPDRVLPLAPDFGGMGLLLEAMGTMEAGANVRGHWKIVSGSGTGALKALSGYARFSARRVQKSLTRWRASTSLTYWLGHSATL